MARVQLLLCLTFLFASVTLMELVSGHLNIKPSLPQIADPQMVKDVEPYTVKVVMVFVDGLEKECPKTNKFKAFFDRLRAYAKYVCPIGKKEKEYDEDMKAKAGSLLQSISSFAVGKIKEEIKEEKEEAIQTFKVMKSVVGKILGGRKKEESEETKLTPEQQKEIKEGIMKWESVITKITNTMVKSETAEGGGDSTSGKESPKGGNDSKNSGSGGGGASFKDTTGPGSNSGGSPSGSPTSSPSGSTKSTTSSGSGTTTVAELEAETSKEVMEFLMKLEKKCPPKEEYKSFFEKLKSTMVGSAKVTLEQKKGFFTAAAGKISDAMSFIGSRITGKSDEVKKSMENYHQEVAKSLQELETIHKNIISANQGKTDDSVTVTAEQRTKIKQTITQWEAVTTQFVETTIQTEASSNTTVGIDKVKLN